MRSGVVEPVTRKGRQAARVNGIADSLLGDQASLQAWNTRMETIRQNTRVVARKLLNFMARPEGFEPPTPRSVVWCSVQLSYGRSLNLRFQISDFLKYEI